MVLNVRTLLLKTKVIKEEIERTTEATFATVQSKLEEYRKLQRSFECTILSEAHFDQRYIYLN